MSPYVAMDVHLLPIIFNMIYLVDQKLRCVDIHINQLLYQRGTVFV